MLNLPDITGKIRAVGEIRIVSTISVVHRVVMVCGIYREGDAILLSIGTKKQPTTESVIWTTLTQGRLIQRHTIWHDRYPGGSMR